MKNWKIWMLVDENGNVLIKGRKKEVIKLASLRYVYQGIFSDTIYRTNEPLI